MSSGRSFSKVLYIIDMAVIGDCINRQSFFTLENLISLDKIFVKVYDSNMEVPNMNEIERLQDKLLLIRRTVGWTAEEFGDRIGVTRQTINNLEAKRNKLTKTQYIAIRAILDAEMVQSPEDTEMLRCLLDVFVDNPDKYDKKDREELLEKANMLTPSILAGTTTRKAVSKELVGIAGAMGIMSLAAISAIPIVGAGVAVGTSAWLAKALKDKE